MEIIEKVKEVEKEPTKEYASKGVAASATAGINLEAERRCCADNKIVNYVNSTFVPQTIAEPTVGTTTHTETIYNPLCGCCSPCGGRGII